MSNVTTAVILVGGQGTRLRSLFSEGPKPLAPIAGQPFLAHIFRELRQIGISRIVLLASYRAEMIEKFVGEQEWGLRVEVVREDPPAGTAGALALARAAVGEEQNFLLMNGDTYLAADIVPMLGPLEGGGLLRVGVCKVENESRYGFVVCRPDGSVAGFEEKGQAKSGYANAGVYTVSAKIFDVLPTGFSSLETDVFPKLVESGRMRWRELDGEFFDFGTPDGYAQLNLLMNLSLAKSPEARRILETLCLGGRVWTCGADDAIFGVLPQWARAGHLPEKMLERNSALVGADDVVLVPQKRPEALLPTLEWKNDPKVIDEILYRWTSLRLSEGFYLNCAGVSGPALFLDRDGVMIRHVPYLSDPNQVALVPGVGSLIRQANAAGLKVIVVTNQSGYARGRFSLDSIEKVQLRLKQLLMEEGAWIDDVIVGTYLENSKRPWGGLRSHWRKPHAGMIQEAARRHRLDLEHSLLIGDRASDILAARRAGIGQIFFLKTEDYGSEAAQVAPAEVIDDFTRVQQAIEQIS